MTETNGLKFCNTASRKSFCDTRWHEEVCKEAENYCQFQLLLKIYCNVFLDLISNSWAHWHSSQSLHDDTKKCAFCFFFLFLNTNQSLHGVNSNCFTLSLPDENAVCEEKKVEVSSAFRLLVGRWKTTSVVGKGAKNSTDRKLTRRNSTEAIIRNLSNNSVKYN